MKKHNHLLKAIAFAFVLIAMNACQSSKTTTASKMMKFNVEKGKGYDYEMNTELDQSFMGQDIKMNMSAYYSMDVKDDDGNLKTIESTFERFKMKMGVTGFNIDVDTEKPLHDLGLTEDDDDPMKMISAIFSAIKGQKFTLKVDAEGKVQEVTGFENMAKTIVDSLGMDEDQKQKLISEFNKQFNGDQLKSQMERTWYIFPNKQVKVGDSWKKNSTVTGQMGGDYSSTYKVVEIEGDMVTLEENSKMNSNEEGKNLKGDITGTIVVDSRIGLVVNVDQDIKMKAEVAGISFEIKGKTKIKGKAR